MNTRNLKFVVSGKDGSSDEPQAAFSTQDAATAWIDQQPNGTDLQVYDLETGSPIESKQLEGAGDHVA